jgi:hypothetical protein
MNNALIAAVRLSATLSANSSFHGRHERPSLLGVVQALIVLRRRPEADQKAAYMYSRFANMIPPMISAQSTNEVNGVCPFGNPLLPTL